MDTNDIKWIELFYADVERRDKNYKRPADYLERGLRILYGKRNKIQWNIEGKRVGSVRYD